MSNILKYNIKSIRADKSIQIKDLCNVCRFSRQTYHRWENIKMNEDKSIPADALQTIAEYLETPIDKLFKKVVSVA